MNSSDQTGRQFEFLIENYLFDASQDPSLVKYMSRLDNQEPSRQGGDGGRDFQLTIPASSPSITLFGQMISPGQTCYVEAKYSHSKSIDYNRVSGNLSKVQNERDVALYFIVTNSYFPPSVQFNLLNDFRRFNAKIILIEGAALRYWLSKTETEWDWGLTQVDPKIKCRNIDVLQLQTHEDKTRVKGESVQYFYMTLRNQGTDEASVRVVGVSDRHWRFDENPELTPQKSAKDHLSPLLDETFDKMRIIPPKQSVSFRLCGIYLRQFGRHQSNTVLQGPQREEGARIVIESAGQSTFAFENIPPIKILFEPEFYGEDNKSKKIELQALFDSVQKNRKIAELHLIHVEGRAGTGKSRLIDESIPFAENSSWYIVKHTLRAEGDSKVGEDELWHNIRSTLAGGSNSIELKKVLETIKDEESLIRVVAGPLQNVVPIGNWGGVVLILEDMHHASDLLCKQVFDLAEENPKLGCHLFLILSGRNDDTYINPSYRLLSKKLLEPSLYFNENHCNPLCMKVKPLKENETEIMVSELIEGIQEAGVERIRKLSGNVPHHIIHTIEHLLDDSLLAITGSNTLSITDHVTFEKRLNSLPASIEALFHCRFDNLAFLSTEKTGSAQKLLLQATFFGTRFPKALFDSIPKPQQQKIFEELSSRRFFADANWDETEWLHWHHENILLFFQNQLRTKGQSLTTNQETSTLSNGFPDAAKTVLNSEKLVGKLHSLRQGSLAVLSEDMARAEVHFSDVAQHAKELTSFFTLDTKTNYFSHIEYVVAWLTSQSPIDEEAVWKLLCLKAYIGGYHLSLRYECDSFQYGLSALEQLSLSPEVKKRCVNWLNAIDAHVHLDSGAVGYALERYQHLLPQLRLEEMKFQQKEASSTPDWELHFDIHNTLRLLFIYTNFSKLAEYHGDIAKYCAKQADTDVLVDAELGDHALAFLMQDRKKCLRLLQQALEANETQGSERHGWHSKISDIAAQLPDYIQDLEWLEANALEAAATIKKCDGQEYYSILPRIFLLAAVIDYLIADLLPNETALRERLDKSLHIANKGLNACETHTVGFISWQLNNLIGVIQVRQGNTNGAGRSFETAMQKIRKEGLTMMGRDGVISAVPVVAANYFRFMLEKKSESKALALIGQFHDFKGKLWNFDRPDSSSIDPKTTCLKLAKKHHHIIPDQIRTPEGVIIDSQSGHAITFWF